MKYERFAEFERLAKKANSRTNEVRQELEKKRKKFI